MQMLQLFMLERRREGARHYFVAGDLKVESRILCMWDSDDLKEIEGPQCCCGIEAPEVFKNAWSARFTSLCRFPTQDDDA